MPSSVSEAVEKIVKKFWTRLKMPKIVKKFWTRLKMPLKVHYIFIVINSSILIAKFVMRNQVLSHFFI